jgi:predicted MFS family arabinose efflux permease
MQRRVSERAIVLLIAAVQFVNILDFMIVMPLGPDFAKGLGIDTKHVGSIAGAYTLAAMISGFVGSFFLDRFDRRKALGVAILGLVLATAAGGLATGLPTLMGARFLAGLFGGPATSLALAIIADLIPPERRGRAMGAVMAAFSVASVLGVPAGLEIAKWTTLGWRLPFFAVAGMGLVVAGLAIRLLPPLRGHLASRHPRTPFGQLFGDPTVLLSYAMTATVMAAGFIVIPHISTYVQMNLGYPRDSLGTLYLVGGILSFGTVALAGRLTDRHGSFRVGAVGSLLVVIITWLGFIGYRPWMPVLAIFAGFMVAMSFRNVAYNTLTTKVPRPEVRARFMSIQSTVQHGAMALASFASSALVTTRADHSLGGITRVATVSIALTVLVPFLLWMVETRVRAKQGLAAQAAVAPAQGSGPVTTASTPPASEAP